MNKTLVAWALALGVAMPAAAATGVFGSYLAIDTDGAGATAPTWYGAQQPGSQWLSAFGGANLGSFALGSTATLAGAELLTWKNGGGDITGATLNWRVDGGSYQSIAIGWTANSTFTDVAGNTFINWGDQKWAGLSTSSTNFLAGLSAGTHTLQVYFTGLSNEGNRDSGSAANPFSASFAVTSPVPEPASPMLLFAGLALLAVLKRRRA
ncbi:PEP-CTERM sorting domain-containing protein [Roseateles sp.]|uniref:PEP-CTERM sorting domain-containing protein n=1 Tax=Roseateles sp. TaxID=1971397 RepID=UPI002DFC911B|nr:PEP-CTERM sorting domain-containing protein [Roseateles sp.]HEV6964592.1 PEP-CTERM sorting domain-containing protein [Roseateles sp.]